MPVLTGSLIVLGPQLTVGFLIMSNKAVVSDPRVSSLIVSAVTFYVFWQDL